MIAAVCVKADNESAAARAIPKSITLTSPLRVSITLPGLMSRCTIPAAWAASRAAQMSAVISSARRGSSRPSICSTSRSVRPSTCSMTMYGTPASSSPVS